MSKRRPPTAGTFARLAVASALACAILPEIIDFGSGVWSPKVAPQTPASGSPGPRVMGSLYTADDDGRGVDRFRFATGTPFDDDGEVLAARPPVSAAVRTDGDGAARMAPDSTTTPALNVPIDREDRGAGVLERQPGPQEARPESTMPSKIPAAIPATIPATVTTAVEAEAEQATPSPMNNAAPHVPAQPDAAPVELGRVKGKSPEAAETGNVSRDAKRATTPRAAQPTRSSGSASSRPKRRSASADGQDSASKPPWRPENLTNWPE